MSPQAPRRRHRVAGSVALALLGLGALTGCGSDAQGPGAEPGGALRIEASFYPLQWMAEQVGGDLVSVANLTPPGAEPHDLELSARDVASLADADLVVYLSGFQPAVDEAIGSAGARSFDVADAAELDLQLEGDGGPGTDPHFWLDPTRLADVADAVAGALADQDPEHAGTYRANAEALAAELADLDGAFERGLADCESTDLVTSHEAFGYLARRYGFEQVGISGLTPEEEPSAADLARVTEFVKDRDVQTIYFETLISPAVAKTVARETGARVDVLDPIEGLSEASAGDDYLQVMRANLANLRTGQSCR